MKLLNIKEETRGESLAAVFVLLAVAAVYFVIWSFTGRWPWAENIYNSYVLEAVSWTQGRLDLGKDYPYLELAIYEGKYFVSFPLFPAYVYFPFALIFGEHLPEGWIAFAVTLIGAVYTYKLVREMKRSRESAVFWTLFAMLGTNVLFTGASPWVWFIAQSMNYTLMMAALYYAKCGRGGISLALWACAVGCRPFSALYIVILLLVLYGNGDAKITVKAVLSNWRHFIAPAAIAVSYMAFNMARFSNPLEFGHTYLPEFQNAEHGQFWLGYIKDNFKNLFILPSVTRDGILEYPKYNGMCMFMISPIFVSYLIYTAVAFAKKRNRAFLAIGFTVCAAALILLTAHKTMGGQHFGNRYTNDVIPLVLFMLMSTNIKEKYDYLNIPLALLGGALNIVGTVMYFA